ncbi:MAG: hypothetical protein QOE68_2676 [Thermoanaerobaculia bacterium]|nr:hypothetical protein [Thermoanaerobaculia bacterium]
MDVPSALYLLNNLDAGYPIYTGYALGAALLLIAVLVGWNRTLSKRIQQRTADLGESEKLQEKLQQSERQLAEAQRLAHVGSWNWDLRTKTMTWSDELYRIFGVQPGEFDMSRDSMLFIHPDDRDLVMSTYDRAVRMREPYSIYYRLLRRDGVERIMHSLGQIVTGEDGDVVRVFGTSQDVTEVKQAEEKLKSTSKQLRALFGRLQSAREEEGIRIARQVHDELGSALTSLRWDLEAIGKMHSESAGQPELKTKIATMLSLTDKTIDVVRRISAELRPSVLDILGLTAALQWQARQFEDRTGIVVHYDSTSADVHLNQEQSTAAFRIFQEALTNILRHAEASRVEVTMAEQAGAFVLTISDDGRGIRDEEKASQSSIGLLGMRERAHLLGGDIDIKGVAGEGTTVRLRLPIA